MKITKVKIFLILLVMIAIVFPSCDLSPLQRNMLITPSGSEEVSTVIDKTVENIQSSNVLSNLDGIVSNIDESLQGTVKKVLDYYTTDTEDISIITPIDQDTKDILKNASETDLQKLNEAYSAPLTDGNLKSDIQETVGLISDVLSSAGLSDDTIFTDTGDYTVGDVVALQLISDAVVNQLLPIVANTDGVVQENGSINVSDINVSDMLSAPENSASVNDAVSTLLLIDKLDTTLFSDGIIGSLISSITNSSNS